MLFSELIGTKLLGWKGLVFLPRSRALAHMTVSDCLAIGRIGLLVGVSHRRVGMNELSRRSVEDLVA